MLMGTFVLNGFGIFCININSFIRFKGLQVSLPVSSMGF